MNKRSLRRKLQRWRGKAGPIADQRYRDHVNPLIEQATKAFEQAFKRAIERMGSVERLHTEHVSTQPCLSKHAAKNRRPNVIYDYTSQEQGKGKSYAVFSARKKVKPQAKMRAIASGDGLALRGLSNENGNRLRITRYGFTWNASLNCWIGNRQQVDFNALFTRFPKLKGIIS